MKRFLISSVLLLFPVLPRAAESRDRLLIRTDLLTKAEKMIEHRLEFPFKSPHSIDFDTNGPFITGSDGLAQFSLWDWKFHDKTPFDLGYIENCFTQFSRGDNRMASGFSNGIIVVRDLVEDKLVNRIETNRSCAPLAIDPNGRLVAAGGSERHVLVWDADTGKKIETLKTEKGRLPGLAFSPDGQFLAAAFDEDSWRDRILVWRTADWKLVRELETGHSPTAVAFSPDGKVMAAGLWTRTIRLWDAETGKKLADLEWPAKGYHHIRKLAYRSDSKTLAAGDEVGGLSLWDLRTHRKISELEGHAKGIAALAFGSSGSLLISADDAGGILVWKDMTLMQAMAKTHEDDNKLLLGGIPAEDLENERDEKIHKLIPPKGEFETTSEYDERVRLAKEEEKRIRGEYARKIADRKQEWIRDFKLRRAHLYPIRARAVLGKYDADKGTYLMIAQLGDGNGKGRGFDVPVPRDDAVKIREKAEKSPPRLYLDGKVRYFDSTHVELVDAAVTDEETGKRYPFGPAVENVLAGKPPDLRIRSIELSDASKDGFLDADEKAGVKISFVNDGKGGAFGVRLRLEVLDVSGSPLPGVELSQDSYAGELAAGMSAELTVPLQGLAGIGTGEARLRAVLKESNGFDSKPAELAFKTRTFSGPRLVLDKTAVLDADGRRFVTKGRECELTFTVTNAGEGPALGAAAVLRSGDPGVKLFGKSYVELGAIAPGEKKKARFSVAVTRRYKGPETLPLQLRFEEKRPKFSAEPELKLVLGQEPADVKVFTAKTRTFGSGTSAGPGIEKPPVVPAEARAFGEHDLAVVIGIERYRNVKQKSDYSHSDSRLVKAYVEALGVPERNIEYMSDDGATRSTIVKSLERWLENRVKPDSRVLVYYSGHGAPDPATGESFLVPYDGDPNYLNETGYPIRRLYEKLGELKAKEVLVVLDACFSGAGGRSVLAKGARPLVMVKKGASLPDRLAVLSAAEGSQISSSSPEKEHGILTYYFLKALQDGKKDLTEVFAYLRPKVEDEAKAARNIEQTPSLRPAPGSLRGRFLFRK